MSISCPLWLSFDKELSSIAYKISFLLFVSHFKWIEKLSWSDSSVHYNGYKIDKSAAEREGECLENFLLIKDENLLMFTTVAKFNEKNRLSFHARCLLLLFVQDAPKWMLIRISHVPVRCEEYFVCTGIIQCFLMRNE